MKFKAEVKGCVRCNRDHGVIFQLFSAKGPRDFVYWGLCPDSGEPLLLTQEAADNYKPKRAAGYRKASPARARSLRRQGVRVLEIARCLSVSRRAVYRYLNE
jgi:hypothetical protein